MRLKRELWIVLAILSAGNRSDAQASDPGRLTLQRIFASRDFFGERFGPAKWLASGDAYTTLELAVGGGTDIVRYDAATGARTGPVPSRRSMRPGAPDPTDIEDYPGS